MTLVKKVNCFACFWKLPIWLENGRLLLLTQYLLSYSGATLGKRTTNQRRSDQNSQMATLGTLLPFPEDSALTKDKISVIRLTGAYLKFQKFLQDGMQTSVLCIIRISYTWNYWRVKYLAIHSKNAMVRFLIGACEYCIKRNPCLQPKWRIFDLAIFIWFGDIYVICQPAKLKPPPNIPVYGINEFHGVLPLDIYFPHF